MKKKLLRIPDKMASQIEAIRQRDYWEGATTQQVIIDILSRGIAWYMKRPTSLKKAVLELATDPITTDQDDNIIDENTKRAIEIAKTPWLEN